MTETSGEMRERSRADASVQAPEVADRADLAAGEAQAGSAAAAAKPSPKYLNPVLVGIITLIAGTSIAAIQYKVPTIMTDLMSMFSMNAEAASWLMSIFTLVGVFVAIPTGALAQRFGAKTMMLVACGIGIIGSIFGLFAGTAPLLIASRAVEGIALTVLTTCGPILVRMCVAPDKIGTAMGVWGIWGNMGSTIAAVVTPTLFENAGFSGVWTAFAVVTAVAAVLLLVVIRVPRNAASAAVADAGAAAAADEAGERPSLRSMLNKDVLLFFISFAIFNICLLAVLSFVPTILQMQDFDPTLSGFISTAPMLLSIISSPLFGVISDKIGRCKPLLFASTLVMGPCTFVLYNETSAVLWVAVAVMGLVGMGGIGQFLSAYAKLVPDPRLASMSMGVMVLVQGVGQFLGTFLVQMLLGPDLTNWFFAGVVLMVMALVGAGCILACKLK